MEVYIEYIVLDNIIINFLLLSLVNKISNLGTRQKNLFIASIIGTIFVVLMPLISSLQFFMLVYRFITGFVMLMFIVKIKKFKKFFASYLVLITITMLFGGLLISALSVFDITYTTSGLLFLNFELPLSLFIFPIWLYYKLFIKIYDYIAEKIRVSKLFFDTTIICFGKKYRLRAFLDTGNNLYDIDGRPIVVMELKTFCSIFPDFPVQGLMLQNLKEEVLSNSHYIKVATVNTTKEMFVFDVDSIIIKKDKARSEFNNVCIGVSYSNFDDYNLILHRNYC